ncbi:ABC transporter permease [Lichenifustis flavocetrariae]|uniref:ABC transporter permease n=1 Tax=Lichenifustis flavocetrariae TaxID=2949735 RepID=A0AA42CJG2_9HYPH|nr:ABC transporter permease [Lichenifustis flavocetrariae]MCW6509409.1 ABC transporter permease [Lichenifustis flavocetrariae]
MRSVAGSPPTKGNARAPVLEIRNLHVHYGASHAVQGVDLTLHGGVLSVVGRNGMGKTTLCKAIMGLVPASGGSIRFAGRELRGLAPADVARLGVGYVPQGRRLWRSLTVDEHLRLVSTKGGAWTIERIYATFPRLAERKTNGGGQLSGGEQQMLAISRALLLNPRLLVMDEPTEGLAPVIVTQVEAMLTRLGQEGDIDVLVIEQNIGVATAVADRVAIMVNGRINREADAAELAGDRDLQQRLLGVGRHAHDETPGSEALAGPQIAAAPVGPRKIYMSNPVPPNRWSQPVPVRLLEQSARTISSLSPMAGEAGELRPAVSMGEGAVIVAGTLDTKGPELRFLRDLLKAQGLGVRLADLSTSGAQTGADIPAHQIAAYHPRGPSGVFTGDRGSSIAGMTVAFEAWMRRQRIGGIIGAGGSGNTAMIAPAMRSLPIGVPKVMISTVASGDVRAYVGASDILMMHAVADVQGLNPITRMVLSNGAHALAGMVRGRREGAAEAKPVDKPAIGITMFGVTTPCVQVIAKALETEADCLVFHATGIGGQSMEALVEAGLIGSVIDITTTEVCDFLFGGVFPATADRFGAVIRRRVPYVGSVGALDMVNFGARETVPERYRGRLFYEHNPQVTLMRTTAEENAEMGRWIGEKLNQMEGPVRFLLPLGGVSIIDRPGEIFYDPAADAALFDALEKTVRVTAARQLIRSPHAINDPAFAAEAVAAHRAITAKSRAQKRQGAR